MEDRTGAGAGMWYGLTKKAFLDGLLIFCVIAILACVATVVASILKGTGLRHWEGFIMLLVGIPGIWVALAAILSITWLKIEGNELSWYLWKRFLLLRCSTEDILWVGGGSFSALVIRTRKGTIRLFGIHAGDRYLLTDRLRTANPDIERSEMRDSSA